MLNINNDKIYVKPIHTSNHVFVEIENKNFKNTLIGVIHRVHAAIHNFITDVDTILQTISNEKKMLHNGWLLT